MTITLNGLSGITGSASNTPMNLGNGLLTAGNSTFSGNADNPNITLTNTLGGETWSITSGRYAIGQYGLAFRNVTNNSILAVLDNTTGLTVSGKLDVGGIGVEQISVFRGHGGNGAYSVWFDHTNNANRGFIGYGDTLFGNGGLANFGIRSQGGLLFSSGAMPRLEIDTDGNIGFRTSTPDSTHTNYSQIFAGHGMVLSAHNAASGAYMSQNAYMHSSGEWYAKETAVSTIFNQGNGAFNWYGNASVAANTQITPILRMALDINGNLGLGIAAHDWLSTYKSIEGGSSNGGVSGTPTSSAITFRYDYSQLWLHAGGYRNTAMDHVHVASRGSNNYILNHGLDAYNGQFTWSMTLSGSGTAGATASMITNMTLNMNNLTVGHSAAQRAIVAEYINTDNTAWNGAASSLFVGRVNGTNRSINAAGTINASGADYAEYEQNNGLTITKGSIVGFKADGTLTLTFSEAIRFGIKSTNPSYVGGDTWGNENNIGTKPEKTVEQTDEEFAEIMSIWQAALETERQKVDRVAYSGKVPVNVTGATPGDYIIAVGQTDGAIGGSVVPKSDMTFDQYQDAVGRVNRVLEDGRAEVAVIVH